MSEPFIGEIKMTAFNFAPRGWSLCNGQILSINLNQALFSLIGTTYGGNGTTTFALPDLRGRSPLDDGAGYTLGQYAGQEAHTLSQAELPTHTHAVATEATVRGVAGNGNSPDPTGRRWAGLRRDAAYSTATADIALSTTAVTSTSAGSGGSQPHNNLPPYLVINFVIALQGIFPSRN
jgi:microcystin-dependent protein